MRGHSTGELDASEHQRIVQSLVTPRPIGWISTTSESGVDNLAPFSCFNYANVSPPVLQVRCGKRENGDLKDTPRNILDTEEFVANLVTESVLEEMDATGASLPPDQSEFDDAGIQRAESETVDPPRVEAAKAQMECTLHDHVFVHDSIVLFGEVTYFHLSEEIMEDGDVVMEQVNSVGRLGGPYYTRSDPIEFER